MKKKTTFLLMLLMCVCSGAWATTYTFDCCNDNTYFTASSGTVTSTSNPTSDYVVAFNKIGSNDNNSRSGSYGSGYVKWCKGNTLSITSASKTFVSVSINFPSKDYGPGKKDADWATYITASTGTLSKISDTEIKWEGDATSSLTITNVHGGDVTGFDFRVRTIVLSTTLTTATTKNAAKTDQTAFAYNANGLPGLTGTSQTEVSFLTDSHVIFSMTGSFKNGSNNFTIGSETYKCMKCGSSAEYVITPASGVTIKSATLYTMANSNSGGSCTVVKADNTEVEAKESTPTEVSLVKNSSGNYSFTYKSGTTTEVRMVVKVTYDAVENIDVTVSSAGYATLFYDKNLVAPTGVTAYKAAVSGSNIALTDIGDLIPANTGVILKADKGRYNFLTSTADASGVNVSGNILTGTTTATTKSTLGGTVYTLGQNASGVVGLRNFTGTDIRAYSAYATSIAGARSFYSFTDDETTGIDASLVKSEKSIVNSFFDLQGRRVAQPTKGLYIVNGKKVVIK